MDSNRKTKGVRIRPEDIHFLESLGTVGILDTNDAAVHYPDHKLNSVQNRLRLLASNRLIRATKLLVSFERLGVNDRGGRIPTLFSLTPHGADLVESMTGNRPSRYLNSEPAPATFLHRQDVARVVSSFTASCQNAALSVPDWVMEQDVWTDGPKKLPPNQRKLLYHRIETPAGAVTCHPDIACRLKLPSAEVALFFEVDRSTEGHKQLTEATRMDAYSLLFKTKSYQRYWPGFSAPFEFVMWVCLSQQRIDNLCKSFAAHPLAERMRFSLLEHFVKRNDILRQPIWQNIHGDFRRIYNTIQHNDASVNQITKT